jgi:hypothetical protein
MSFATRYMTETTPLKSGDVSCRVFAWIGQSFESCENCGKPYWDHKYNAVYGGSKSSVRIKIYQSWSKKWYWRPVTIITPESAEATKAKWDGYLEWVALGRGSS